MPEFRRWAKPETFIAKEYIDVEDDVYFRVAADAANCFGGKRRIILQTPFISHPRESGKTIWFPKFYENPQGWINIMSGDGKTITSKNESQNVTVRDIDKILSPNHKCGKNRIVFGHIYHQGYRFEGEFELHRQATNFERGSVWRRVSERAKTYQLSECRRLP